MNTLTKNFLITTLTKIHKEPTRKNLIYLHNIICCNDASIPLNLGGRSNKLVALTLTQEQYKENSGNKYEMKKGEILP